MFIIKKYLNQLCHIVNWTLGNKCQSNSNQYKIIVIQENAFDNAVYEMAAILFDPQYVNISPPRATYIYVSESGQHWFR